MLIPENLKYAVRLVADLKSGETQDTGSDLLLEVMSFSSK